MKGSKLGDFRRYGPREVEVTRKFNAGDPAVVNMITSQSHPIISGIIIKIVGTVISQRNSIRMIRSRIRACPRSGLSSVRVRTVDNPFVEASPESTQSISLG